MRVLHHEPLSPFCRKIRLTLAEKKLPFDMVMQDIWHPSAEFLDLNPAGTVPILVDEPDGEDGAAYVVSHSMAIVEYLEDAYPEHSVLPGAPAARAEIRRLVGWFDDKFNIEVSQNLVFEKLVKRQAGFGGPDMGRVRRGLENIAIHLEYIGILTEERSWLAGDQLSLADLTAAAHISSVDYLGDVPWARFPAAKAWYERVKSRPSVRALLGDRVPGMPPPRHYADLDF